MVKNRNTTIIPEDRPRPCPFCGAAALVEHWRNTGLRRVRCSICGAAPGRMYAEAESAMAAWNSRSYETCSVCGGVVLGLMCRRRYFDFITGELLHG